MLPFGKFYFKIYQMVKSLFSFSHRKKWYIYLQDSNDDVSNNNNYEDNNSSEVVDNENNYDINDADDNRSPEENSSNDINEEDNEGDDDLSEQEPNKEAGIEIRFIEDRINLDDFYGEEREIV